MIILNGVIQSVQEMPISLTNNTASITFANDDVRSRSANCNCGGWLSHSQGSPLYQILDGGYYEVDFNANVSTATPRNCGFCSISRWSNCTWNYS